MNIVEIEQELVLAVSEVLTKYGEILVHSIKEQIAEKKKLASGALYNSITFEVKVNGSVVLLSISAADYFKYVDLGRKPGSTAPPIFPIVKWLEQRRLDVLGTDFFRTGIKTRVSSAKRRKAIALVQKQHPVTVVQKAFLIAKAIGIKGIKGINATKKAMDTYSERLYIQVDEVIAAKSLEILERAFQNSMANNGIKVNTAK